MFIVMLLFIFVCIYPLKISGFVSKVYTTHGRDSCLSSGLKSNEDTLFKDKSIFIFGLGYVGLTFARGLLSNGWKVSGTCTNYQRIQSLQNQGINAFLFDTNSGAMIQKEANDELMGASYVLSTIPPDSQFSGDAVLQYHGKDLMRATLSGKLRWIGYLSSTGVYGDRAGAWVKETDILRPDNPKTKARAEAELEWRLLRERSGLPVNVFRLCGIYGPGRNALITVAKAGGDLRLCGGSDDRSFISRIHVDDICQTLLASMVLASGVGVGVGAAASSGGTEGGVPPMLLNVADDVPSTRYEVLSYCNRLLGYPVSPPEDTVDTAQNRGDGWTSRGGSKRVDNSAMRRMLRAAAGGSSGVISGDLVHPDYRSGLQSILNADPDLSAIAAANAAAAAVIHSKNTDIRPVTDSQPTSSSRSDSSRIDTENEVRDLRRRVQILETQNALILTKLDEFQVAIKKLLPEDFL